MYRLSVWHRDKWVRAGYFYSAVEASEFIGAFFGEEHVWKSPIDNDTVLIGLVEYKPAYILVYQSASVLTRVEHEQTETGYRVTCDECGQAFEADTYIKAVRARAGHQRVHKQKEAVPV